MLLLVSNYQLCPLLPPAHYIHACTCVHVCTYVHMYVYMYIHTYICTYTHTHTYVHTHIHTYVHTYVRTHIHTHTFTYIHTYIHTYICTYVQQTSKCLLPPFCPIHNYHQLPLLTTDHIAVVSYIKIFHSRQPICAHGSEITVGTPAVPLQHKGGSKDTSTSQNSTEGFHLVCERRILDGSRGEKHLNCIYGSAGVWKVYNIHIYT